MRITILVAITLLSFSCKKPVEVIIQEPIPVGDLKLNQFQAVGSHNSYKLHLFDNFLDSLLTIKGSFPDSPLEMDYQHESLTDQLELYGVRQFELDVYHDPVGGQFYNQMGLDLILGMDASSNEPLLLEPGLKLIHIPDIDFRTSQIQFISALEEIKQWSDLNPNHFPIMILIEAKTESIDDWLSGFGFTTTFPVSDDFLQTIDNEISSVFDIDHLITPIGVKGSRATLNAAITEVGWPTLHQSRGKVMFCFNNGGDDAMLYLGLHENIDSQIMFTVSPANHERAAFLMYNEPTDVPQDLLSQGYLIRTRSDVGTWEARSGDYSRMNDAFASGAQFISTDYYRPDERFGIEEGWTDYQVSFAGGAMVQVNRTMIASDVVGDIE